MHRIIALWNRGCLGKAIIGTVGLLVISCIFGVVAPRPQSPAPVSVVPTETPIVATVARQPTALPAPTVVPAPTDVPTAVPVPTDAPTREPAPPEAPTAAPRPTAAPAAAPATDAPAVPLKPVTGTGGVAPIDVQRCPADAPIKGNIRDRNPDKGAKIYHLPGDNGYAQTKPERCFATAADAEAAGFRPVK